MKRNKFPKVWRHGKSWNQRLQTQNIEKSKTERRKLRDDKLTNLSSSFHAFIRLFDKYKVVKRDKLDNPSKEDIWL